MTVPYVSAANDILNDLFGVRTKLHDVLCLW